MTLNEDTILMNKSNKHVRRIHVSKMQKHKEEIKRSRKAIQKQRSIVSKRSHMNDNFSEYVEKIEDECKIHFDDFETDPRNFAYMRTSIYYQ